MANASLVTLVGVDVPPLSWSGVFHVPSQHNTTRLDILRSFLGGQTEVQRLVRGPIMGAWSDDLAARRGPCALTSEPFIGVAKEQ